MELDEIEQKIITRIKEKRIQLSISRRTIAELADISEIHYTRIERGDYFPRLSILVRILNILKLKLVVSDE